MTETVSRDSTDVYNQPEKLLPEHRPLTVPMRYGMQNSTGGYWYGVLRTFGAIADDAGGRVRNKGPPPLHAAWNPPELVWDMG